MPPDTSLPSDSRSLAALARAAALLRHIGLDLGPIDPPFLPFATAAKDRLLVESLLSFPENVAPGLPLKARGAHAIAFLSYQLAGVLALLLLQSRRVPASGSAAGLAWSSGTEDDRQTLHLRITQLVPVSAATDAGEVLSAWMAPFVSAIASETRLAAAAQWALVADSLALAFQESGRALGNEAEGRETALAILRNSAPPLRASKASFVRIVSPGDGRERFFLERSGCCLAYQAPGGVLCDTCRLHPPEERRQRLTAFLESRPPI